VVRPAVLPSLALAVAALVLPAGPVAGPAAAGARCGPVIGDVALAGRFAALGGDGGPLGCATSAVVAGPAPGTRVVQVRHGQLVGRGAPGAPDHGVIAVFGTGRCLAVDWDLAPGTTRARVDWVRNGDPAAGHGTVDLDPGAPVPPGPPCAAVAAASAPTTGRWAIAADDRSGVYTVQVRWCGSAAPCEVAAAAPVIATVAYEPAPMAGAYDLYGVALGGPGDIPPTGAQARATVDRRRRRVLGDAACRPLDPEATLADGGDDLTAGLLARLGAAALGLSCPGGDADGLRAEAGARLAALTVEPGLRVGSDAPGLCADRGNYDFALQGLTAIAAGYGDGLDPAVRAHIVRDLLVVQGPLDPAALGTVHVCGLTVPGVETENHVLQIASAQYLANDLRRAVLGDRSASVDNGANGSTAWLLRLLQSFVRHDFAEYNSRPYSGFVLRALTNLAGYAADERVRTGATLVVDYLTAKYAVGSNGSRRAAPFRRSADLAPDTSLVGFHDDHVSAWMMVWTGDTTHLAEVDPPFHGHVYDLVDRVYAAVSRYLPATPVLDLALHPFTGVERVVHGTREPGDLPQAGTTGGVEVYASAPRYLITAGGISTDSVTLGDERGRAVPSTVMPTAEGTDASDLVRIDGHADARYRANTCVAVDFLCGENPVIPESLRPCSFGDGYRGDLGPLPGGWVFVDPAACGRDQGVRYARYRATAPVDTARRPPGSTGTDATTWGFVVVAPAGGLPLRWFALLTLIGAHAWAPPSPTGENRIVTVTGHAITFTPFPPPETPTATIGAVDGQPVGELTTRPDLIAGPAVHGDGRRGRVEITAACHDAGLCRGPRPAMVLDFTDAPHPVIEHRS
jgi:hypothetical protein